MVYWGLHTEKCFNTREGYQDRNPLDKNPMCQTPQKSVPYELSSKSQVHFLENFFAYLKDVFMGLPCYIQDFSALTAWQNLILCAMLSCELR